MLANRLGECWMNVQDVSQLGRLVRWQPAKKAGETRCERNCGCCLRGYRLCNSRLRNYLLHDCIISGSHFRGFYHCDCRLRLRHWGKGMHLIHEAVRAKPAR